MSPAEGGEGGRAPNVVQVPSARAAHRATDDRPGHRLSLPSLRIPGDRSTWVVYATFLVIFVAFAIGLEDRGFLTEANLQAIVRQAIPIAIMAMAIVFVLTAGEIDLSISSVIALAAMVSAVVLRDSSFVLAALAGLGAGVAVGLFNGLLVTRMRVPSFLVTLASFELVAGLSRAITDLEPIAVADDTFVSVFGGGQVGPFSTLTLWGIGAVASALFLFHGTRFGAHVRATGDNRQAATTAGINTRRVKVQVLVLSACAAALAGMLLAGRLEGARYTLGENDLLTVFAAAIIGGTSLFGGRGSIVGAVAGALLLAMLNNGLILFGLSVSEQRIALGGMLVLAITLSLRERKE